MIVAPKDAPATLKADKDKAFSDRFPLEVRFTCDMNYPHPNRTI
jgi:hypothetical protein